MKQKRKRRPPFVFITLVMLACLLAANCIPALAEEDVVKITKVEISESAISEVVDLSGDVLASLYAEYEPYDATANKLTWSSSDVNVISAVMESNDAEATRSVDLYAKSTGTATITVTAINGTLDPGDDVSATCTVTVTDPYEIGTVWLIGDNINLHGAWFVVQKGDDYKWHSTDATVTVPKPELLQSGKEAKFPEFLPVCRVAAEDWVDYIKSNENYGLQMPVPDDKTEETPIGIRLSEGAGTRSNPYVFELAYKTAPEVTAPEAKSLTFNEQKQELVKAGNVTGGKMQYALGNDDSKAPETGWNTTIPTGTEAGTYYVWYKAVGDAYHNNSEPACVTSEIKEAENKDPEGEDPEEEDPNEQDPNKQDPNKQDPNKQDPNKQDPNKQDPNKQDPENGNPENPEKETIKATITFRVKNGFWEDGTTVDKKVVLSGKKGDVLKLSAEDIPGVGLIPYEGCKEGSWDTVPNTETAITRDTIYTYIYEVGRALYYTIAAPSSNEAVQDSDNANRFNQDTGSMPGLLSGWVLERKEWYYYIRGEKQHGWQWINGFCYYLDPGSGIMQTGWIEDNGRCYYLDPESGKMLTGWIEVNGSWYYSDFLGIKNGWIEVNGSWYYLDPETGIMQTGWLLDKGDWYYLDPETGIMQTGWLLDKDDWYYLDPKTGIMQTGWLLDKDNRYYLDPETGKMQTGQVLIDNAWYEFDENGKWNRVDGLVISAAGGETYTRQDLEGGNTFRTPEEEAVDLQIAPNSEGTSPWYGGEEVDSIQHSIQPITFNHF